MSQMTEVCKTCEVPVNDEFRAGTGLRQTLELNSQQFFEERCLVRDTIVFKDGGGIVFKPRMRDEGRFEYHDDYNVICRRLVVMGGKSNPEGNPCRPDDPGNSYLGVNVITWEGRLRAAADGAPHANNAPDGGRGMGETPFDPNVWQSGPHGDNGAKGHRGHNGAPGNPGRSGMNALDKGKEQFGKKLPTLNIVALEVEFIGIGSKLVVDWDGQTGGDGGRGQNAGRGGPGMGGRDGSTAESVWGDECERAPGNGGDAGDGGDGGPGGNGGDGGWAGQIWVISTAANLTIGQGLNGPDVKYVYGGASGGDGAAGGRGGQPSPLAGRKGKKTSECEDAQNGQAGQAGNDSGVNGGSGVRGRSGRLDREPIDPPNSGTCADLIPLGPPLAVTSISPNSGARSATVPVTIVGTGFTSAATVLVSGPGVTVGTPTVTPTQITTTLTIGNLAPQNARDVTVRLSASQQATLTGGFTVT
jgi:hypothetical protein